MFEKEAEEFERRKHYRYEDNDYCCDIADGIIQAYLAGAEFGYNKANEWHYVKDVEYPTHSNRVLVLTDEGVGFGMYGLDNKKWYTYDTGFDVIAWKEITLPAPPNEVKEK